METISLFMTLSQKSHSATCTIVIILPRVKGRKHVCNGRFCMATFEKYKLPHAYIVCNLSVPQYVLKAQYVGEDTAIVVLTELTSSFYALHRGSANYSQGLKLAHFLFLLIQFYCKTATLVHLCTNYRCFHIIVAESTSYSRDPNHPQEPHFLIPSPEGLEFQCIYWGRGHKHSDHSCCTARLMKLVLSSVF